MAAVVNERDREAFERRRRSKSVALGIVLAALVALFYAITIVRIGFPK